MLAPTKELMDTYKALGQDWNYYEKEFNNLLMSRAVENKFNEEYFNNACLMCSEDTPDKCHRRLVAEYLASHWGNVEISHL